MVRSGWGVPRSVGAGIAMLVVAVAVTAALVPASEEITTPHSVPDKASHQAISLAPARSPQPARDPAGMRAAGNSPVRVVDHVRTDAPVVFLTMDDGVTKSRSILRWFQRRQVPATAFLADADISLSYGYFKRLQRSGVDIQNHTSGHVWLRGTSARFQRDEICSASKRFASVFGNRPRLLRPPFGVWDNRTRHAARRCGIRWIVQWSAVIDRGEVDYRSGFHRLRRGDIVLLHFTPSTTRDLALFLRLAKRSGLRPAYLQDYLH